MPEQVDVREPVIPAQQATDKEPEKKISDKEINFERLRKKAEATEAAYQDSQELIRQQAQMLDALKSQMQQQQPPQQQRDVWDDIPDGELIDKDKLRRTLERERANVRKEAEEIARAAFQKIDKENFAYKLKSQYPDYDQVLTRDNAQKLEERDPEYAALLTEVSDDFKRRELAYKRIKKMLNEQKPPETKAQEVVNENKKSNYYYSPVGQGAMNNPYAFEFDVRSPEARTAAYAKLKAAQKRSL